MFGLGAQSCRAFGALVKHVYLCWCPGEKSHESAQCWLSCWLLGHIRRGPLASEASDWLQALSLGWCVALGKPVVI